MNKNLLVWAALLVAGTVGAQVYRCDVAGQVTYTDAPCASGVGRSLDLRGSGRDAKQLAPGRGDPSAATQQPPRPLPAEIDTIGIPAGAEVVPLQGEIWVRRGDGAWARLEAPFRPGSSTRLLVARGAAFKVGQSTFGPESHGDRQVAFVFSNARFEEKPELPYRTAPLVHGREGCVTIVGSRGMKTTCETTP